MNEQSRGTLKKESKVRKKQTKKISKADTIDLIKGGRNKNLLSKSPGGSFNLINSNINKDFSQGNLVGKTGFSNKSNIFKKNNDAKKGSALMNENILGSATEKKGGKKIW